MSKVVLCEYYVQNEDKFVKGKKQIFNAYVLPKNYNSIKEVRVSDVKKYFPFNSTEYHFRFQTRMGSMKVWVDTSKDSVAVPIIDNKIRMKLLRLPTGVAPKPPRIVPEYTKQSKADTTPPSHDMSHGADLLNPGHKKKSIPHSNSQNNIAGRDLPLNQNKSQKPMSQNGDDGDLLGAGHSHHNVPKHDQFANEMDFNLDPNDILGGFEDTNDIGGANGYSHQASDGSGTDNGSNLLGDFDTMHQKEPEQPTPPRKYSSFI